MGAGGARRTVGVAVELVVVVAAVAVVALVGCASGGGDGSDGGEGGPSEDERAELRRELLAMQRDDQAERTGQAPERWNDTERTERLAEILDEHGWPGRDLVGEDGASAAWLIAQHSDLDVDLQERALDLMREAVEDGRADRSELAYLEDRVALNRGRPQTYGTQIGCVDGRAEPAELADPDGVDERRADVGLGPLADYLDDLAADCAAEAESRPDSG